MIPLNDAIDLAKFAGKLLMVVMTGIFTSPYLQQIILKIIERWSAKKVEHIELAAQTFDVRIAKLESITSAHAKRMDAHDLSNRVLIDKLTSCESQIQKTGTDIGSTGQEIRKTVDTVKISIIERLEKDEGQILVHESAIQGLLGKVKVIDTNKKP